MIPLLLVFASSPALAQSGLCSAIPDREARLECLGRPPERAPVPVPPAAALRECTRAIPCHDSAGAYYTGRSGGKRYIRSR
ncbi:hypothetical protein [Roseococcus pinisoli]|uniref:Uncharacterized protein n=1 Tax=Roseococcus pinisoli TaxID=2835040 RepID=A0ABS5QET6_9PROT|nr:hypothetical protein [Roseococcus pinisoli]MBS7812079.1 hypothetical protein [Roseococcus pinisoli]